MKKIKQMCKYYNRKRSIDGSIKIRSPNQMSLLSPTTNFLKRRFSSELTINDDFINKKIKSTNNIINHNNDRKYSSSKDIDNKQLNLTHKSSGISTQSESDIQLLRKRRYKKSKK